MLQMLTPPGPRPATVQRLLARLSRILFSVTIIGGVGTLGRPCMAAQATGAIRVYVVEFMATPRAPLAGVQTVLDGNEATCTTDSTGSCVFTAVPTGQHIVTMSCPGFETLVETVEVHPGGTSRAGNIMVGRHPRVFAGTVSDSMTGNPIAGALVVVHGARNRRLAGTGVTDSAGHYVIAVAESAIASPQPWWFDVFVDHPGSLSKLADFQVDGSETAFVSVPLADTLRTLIRGTVTAAETGRQVSGARVSTGYEEIPTDADGRYKLPALPGEHRYTASAKGYRASESTITVNDGQHVRLDFALHPEPAGQSDPRPSGGYWGR